MIDTSFKYLFLKRSQYVSLLIAFFILSSCTQQADQTIKIGVVLPLSGDFQIYGSTGLKGALLAVDEVNATGGLLGGRQLELIITDNKTDPSESIRLTRQLIQNDNVISLMGPVSSSARNAVLEEARKFKTPLLYGIDYEGNVFDRYLFCYSTIPEHYIEPVLPHLLSNEEKSVYILGYDYVWPHELAKVIVQQTRENNGRVVGKDFIQFGIKDFSKHLERIKKTKAKTLVLIMPGNDGFEFIRQLHASGLKNDIQVLAIAADENYLKELTADELEGIYTGLHFFASLSDNKSKQFIQKYQNKYGQNSIPTYTAESHYGLVKLLAAGIQKAGNLNKEKIINAMENRTIESGASTVKARRDHHFDLPMFLAQFSKGELVIRQSLGNISPPDQRVEN